MAAMTADLSERRGRAWPMVLIALILAASTAMVAAWQSRVAAMVASGVEPPEDASSTLLQHLAFTAMVALFARHQWRVLLFLLGTMARNWFIGLEIVLLLSIVYGAFSSFGVPELFWDDPPLTVGVAGFGAAAFLSLAWYAIYLLDVSGPSRSRQRRLNWDQLEPVVIASGIPALLRLKTAGLSTRRQFACCLAAAMMPGLFLLALPAFLPAIRPGGTARDLEWPWLVGLAAGAMLPHALLTARPLVFLDGVIRRFRARASRADDNEGEVILRPGILLWSLGLVYVTCLVLDRFRPDLIVPAALICLMLAMIAVSVAFYFAIRNRRARRLGLLVIPAALLLNGIQTYDSCYRGLEDYYPPDPLRSALGLPSPFSSGDGSPVDLVDFQEKNGGRKAREDAVESRTRILENWRRNLADARSGARKPILVVVATGGGALRAGLWTASVLEALAREVPEFPEHVRFVTGASGGMVGAAGFVTTHQDRISRAREAEAGAADPRSPRPAVDCFASDYLSPIARQFILRDVPLFIFPWRQRYDRGHALEDALTSPDGIPGLSRTFDDLREDERAGRLPSIIFSPMLVEDGRRLLISNLDLADIAVFDGDSTLSEDPREIVELIEAKAAVKLPRRDRLEFRRINAISAIELFRLFPRARDRLRVVTAVRMNATFPFVTPAGVLPTEAPRQVVDAGYYDNYGVDLATSLLFSHREWILRNTSGVLLVQIRAFRNEKQLKVLDQPILQQGFITTASTVVNVLWRGLRWVTSPVTGLAEARTAVMHYRNDGQVEVLGRYFQDRTPADPEFFKTVIFTCDTAVGGTDEQQVETLNWHLSAQEVDRIKANMRTRDQNRIRLDRLGRWWRQRMGNAPHAAAR
ncbi:patatin-like phospholipase family protein [Aquisphaera insulae]|uniref:patatin-like phospholipase family protein n=1 Tax=Aquisphaera insulae TaxID=2712864 RepID=UPI0013EDE478|nr:patatin-like phospholipase family protein [Aquisphaera insulae]